MSLTEQQNQYVKELSTLDAYLMRIVKRYFDIENLNTLESREGIISEAIIRFKSEINYEMAAVTSLNNKRGAISFSLLDLNGESCFSKKSAFNKEFGVSPQTMCWGNDDRLSDNRIPKKHGHSIYEIDGNIIEILTGYKNNLEVLIKTLHTHSNKDVLSKITYSGAQLEIDLLVLEQMATMINTHIDQLKTTVTLKNTYFLLLLQDLKKKIEEYGAILDISKTKIEDILLTIQKDVNDGIIKKKNILVDLITETLKTKVTQSDLDVLKQSLRLPMVIGEDFIELSELGDLHEKEFPLSDIILDQQDFYTDIRMKAWVRFKDTNDKINIVPVPYYKINNGGIESIVNAIKKENSLLLRTGVTPLRIPEKVIPTPVNEQVASDGTRYNLPLGLIPDYEYRDSTGNLVVIKYVASDQYFTYYQARDYITNTYGASAFIPGKTDDDIQKLHDHFKTIGSQFTYPSGAPFIYGIWVGDTFTDEYNTEWAYGLFWNNVPPDPNSGPGSMPFTMNAISQGCVVAFHVNDFITHTHVWTETIIKEPTMFEEGILKKVCSVDGEERIEAIPKLPIQFTNPEGVLCYQIIGTKKE